MRTRTIFEARIKAGLRYAAGFHDRAERQVGTFQAELLRRMDERDAWHTMFPVSTPEAVASIVIRAKVIPFTKGSTR